MDHQELVARSLAMHRLIAEKIRQDPALFEKPKETLARWRTFVCPNSQPYLEEWQRLLDQGMEACLAVATKDSEHAATLRQASPFCGILSEEERREFLLAWGKEHRSYTDQDIEDLRQRFADADARREEWF